MFSDGRRGPTTVSEPARGCSKISPHVYHTLVGLTQLLKDQIHFTQVQKPLLKFLTPSHIVEHSNLNGFKRQQCTRGHIQTRVKPKLNISISFARSFQHTSPTTPTPHPLLKCFIIVRRYFT